MMRKGRTFLVRPLLLDHVISSILREGAPGTSAADVDLMSAFNHFDFESDVYLVADNEPSGVERFIPE